MPSISSLLFEIPDEFKPVAALGIGAVILVVLVLFHGISLHRILVQFKRAEMRLRAGRPHLWRAAILFGWSVFLMLCLHILEITSWAFALVHLGLILRATDAIYFCANAYTTLGYGTVDLGVNWRNISPIIAISGLFTFAWTTSSLVSIVTSYLRLVEQLEAERLQELDLRTAARKAEWGLLNKEKDAEQALREKTRERARAVGFFERRKIWRQERRDEKTMRAEEHAEFEAIRSKENQDEEKLGPGPTPDKSGGDT